MHTDILIEYWVPLALFIILGIVDLKMKTVIFTHLHVVPNYIFIYSATQLSTQFKKKVLF